MLVKCARARFGLTAFVPLLDRPDVGIYSFFLKKMNPR